MERKATIYLEGGKFDGLEIVWPESAGDFPAVIQFGHYVSDGKSVLRDPATLVYIRYDAIHCWSDGPRDQDDGLPIHCYQTYLSEGTKSESIPSVIELWDKQTGKKESDR